MLIQPGTAELAISVDDDNSVVVTSADFQNLSIGSDSSALKKSIQKHIFEKSPDYDRTSVVFLEAQFSLLGKNNHHPYSFKYSGGTAIAISSHHLITTLDVVRPNQEWYKENGTPAETVWKITLIKERDPSITIPPGMKPHEYDLWGRSGSEYKVVYEDTALDIVVLHSNYSHLRLPVSLNVLGYGKPVYAVDIQNAFAAKVFDGTSSLSNESNGVFYNNGYISRGPVLGIHQHPLDIDTILIDRHAAFVGVLISDAGKATMNARNISRFVSIAAILDHIKRFYPDGWNEIEIKKSIYDPVEQEKEEKTETNISPLEELPARRRYPDLRVRSEVTQTEMIPGPPEVKNWRIPVYKSGLPIEHR